MRNHINVIHKKIRAHVCPICQSAFGEAGTMRNHVTTVHEKIRAHKCPYCPSAFGQAGNMRTHIKRMHKDQLEQNIKRMQAEKLEQSSAAAAPQQTGPGMALPQQTLSLFESIAAMGATMGKGEREGAAAESIMAMGAATGKGEKGGGAAAEGMLATATATAAVTAAAEVKGKSKGGIVAASLLMGLTTENRQNVAGRLPGALPVTVASFRGAIYAPPMPSNPTH